MRTIDKINDQECLIKGLKQEAKAARKTLAQLKYDLLKELHDIKIGDRVMTDGVVYEVTGITFWKDYSKRPVLAGYIVLSSGVVEKLDQRVSIGERYNEN